jgi:hypothetical protein
MLISYYYRWAEVATSVVRSPVFEFNPSRFAADLLVGSYPAEPSHFERLRDEFGVDAVYNLQTNDDIFSSGLNPDVLWHMAVAADHSYVRHPIKDFDPSAVKRALAAALEDLHRLVDDGCHVYVHCTAGINRSATITLAYQILRDGKSADEVVRAGLAVRPQIRPYQSVLEATARDRKKLWKRLQAAVA